MALQNDEDSAKAQHLTLENAEPELCIEFINLSSFFNFQGLRRKIEASDEKWLNVGLKSKLLNTQLI